MSQDYRVVEIAPADGQRHGKTSQVVLYKGPDVALVRQAIADYWSNGKRRPWGETCIYLGRRRVYTYELPSVKA